MFHILAREVIQRLKAKPRVFPAFRTDGCGADVLLPMLSHTIRNRLRLIIASFVNLPAITTILIVKHMVCAKFLNEVDIGQRHSCKDLRARQSRELDSQRFCGCRSALGQY